MYNDGYRNSPRGSSAGSPTPRNGPRDGPYNRNYYNDLQSRGSSQPTYADPTERDADLWTGQAWKGTGSSAGMNSRPTSNMYYTPEDSLRRGKSIYDDIGTSKTSPKSERENESTSSGLIRVFNRYADRCSLNGVPFISQSKSKVVMVTWTCLLVLGIGFMSFHLYSICDSFFEYRKQTQIQLSFSTLPFPAVTICNANPLRMSQRSLVSDELNEYIDVVDPDRALELLREYQFEYSDEDDDYYEDADIDFYEYDEDGERRKRSVREKRAVRTRSKNFLDNTDTLPNGTVSEGNIEKEYFSENEEDSWEALSTPSGQSLKLDTFRDLLTDQPSSVRARVGHQINDMLLQCAFSGGQCYSRNFSRLQSSHYGNCWVLQNTKFISRNSGPKYGLEMQLFLETDEYVPGISTSKGLQVVIHEQGTIPFPDEDGIAISPGTETQIGLRMIQIERLGSPWGKCTPIEKFRKEYGIKYSKSTCLKICNEKEVRSRCNCYKPQSLEIARLLKTNTTMRPCRSSDEVRCAISVNNLFQNSTNSLCDCESPCNQTVFERTISTREFPTNSTSNLLRETVCSHNAPTCDQLRDKDPSQLRSEWVKLVIFYEDLNFEKLVEQEDYELVQFISDVGGTLGLWIGLSVLSVFEIFHLIADAITYLCFRRRKVDTAHSGR